MAHLNIEFSQCSLKHHWVRCEGHRANICGKREMHVGFPEHRRAKGKSICHSNSGPKPSPRNLLSATHLFLTLEPPLRHTFTRLDFYNKVSLSRIKPIWKTYQASFQVTLRTQPRAGNVYNFPCSVRLGWLGRKYHGEDGVCFTSP